MKVNYQIALERELQRIADSGRRPRLLLHSCCAPCSSYVLEYLNRAFDIAVYYYNPNIAPAEEFEHRVAEQIRLAEALPHEGHIEVIRGEYDLYRQDYCGCVFSRRRYFRPNRQM